MTQHALTGRKQSPEHVAKRVAACAQSGAYVKSAARFAAMNRANAGKPLPEAQKEKISKAMQGKQNCLGVVPSLAHRKKLSEYWLNNKEKHNHYKDGKAAERRGERRTAMGGLPYRLWRESVFQRDNWTCVHCYAKGGQLHADHIKLYSTHPELRYEISNGRTLCVACHRSRRQWEVPA